MMRNSQRGLYNLMDGSPQVKDQVGEGEHLSRLCAAHLRGFHLSKPEVELSREKPGADLRVRRVVRVVLRHARREGARHLAQGPLNLK